VYPSRHNSGIAARLFRLLAGARLHATNAPFVVNFLQARFKRSESIAIAELELLGDLEGFQEDVYEAWPDRF
jgi:hypothetical protein